MEKGGFYSISMRHYQQALEECPEWSNYDKKFKESIEGMVHNFHSRGGGEGSSNTETLSFDIIKKAMTCMLENNTQAANEILAYKQGMGGNAQMLRMVNSYFKLCRTTLDSLHRWQVSLGVCRDKLTAVLHLDRPAEEVKQAFRCADGVLDNLFLSLPHLIGKHVSMLIPLQQAMGEDMTSREACPENSTARKVITIMLATVFASALIFSVLASAFHLAPVLVTLPTAVNSILSWSPFLEWLDDFWAGDQKALRRRAAERVAKGEKRNVLLMQELEHIKLLMDTRISSGSVNVTVSNRERGELSALLKSMTESYEQMEKCRTGICAARRNFLQTLAESNRRRDRFRAFISRLAACWS